MMKRFALPLLLAVSACGVIPTPAVDVPDAEIPLSATMTVSDSVVYLERDALGGVTLPSLLQGLTVRGDALYVSRGGTLKTVELFVRASLPASCTRAGVLVVCPAAGEQTQSIGTVTLSGNTPSAFTLAGAALDTAAKQGRAYFGVRVREGQPLDSESVKLTRMKAQARL